MTYTTQPDLLPVPDDGNQLALALPAFKALADAVQAALIRVRQAAPAAVGTAHVVAPASDIAYPAWLPSAPTSFQLTVVSADPDQSTPIPVVGVEANSASERQFRVRASADCFVSWAVWL